MIAEEPLFIEIGMDEEPERSELKKEVDSLMLERVRCLATRKKRMSAIVPTKLARNPGSQVSLSRLPRLL